jgi:hypothetical protein
MPSLSRRRILALAGVLALASVATYAAVRHHRFHIDVRRRAHTVAPGEAATYSLRVSRTKATRHWVRMEVKGLPAGARAEWRRQGRVVDHVMRHGGRKIRLKVYTSTTTPVGRYRLRVVAVHKRTRAHKRLILRVRRIKLGVRGDLQTPLFPGATVPFEATFTNPLKRPMHLDTLSVTIAETTSRPTCSGTNNFRVTQMLPQRYVLPPGDTPLHKLEPDSSRWPQISMLNLPVSQDTCKDTTLTLLMTAEGSK